MAKANTDTVIKQSNSIVIKHSNNKVCKNRIEMLICLESFDERDLSMLLNHSQRDVTDQYVQASSDLKRKNAELVTDFYNHNSNFALNELALTWYASNSKIFSQRTEKYQNEEMDFRTS